MSLAGALVGAGCGASTTAPSPTVSYVSISGSATFTNIGQRVQMIATAGFSNNTSQVVTSQATWESSNSAVVTISNGGLATAVAGGQATLRATYRSVTGQLPISIQGALFEDCIPYDTAGLKIIQEPDDWLLTDGFERMAILDTIGDAANALALAQRYSKQCFIGRGNGRANRQAYIVDYWAGPTGVVTTISPEDCQSYTASNLQIVNLGATGWAVMDGSTQFLLLDNQSDANAALALAKQYAAHCFIGRNNTRPNPATFIVPYWK